MRFPDSKYSYPIENNNNDTTTNIMYDRLLLVAGGRLFSLLQPWPLRTLKVNNKKTHTTQNIFTYSQQVYREFERKYLEKA